MADERSAAPTEPGAIRPSVTKVGSSSRAGLRIHPSRTAKRKGRNGRGLDAASSRLLSVMSRPLRYEASVGSGASGVCKILADRDCRCCRPWLSAARRGHCVRRAL